METIVTDVLVVGGGGGGGMAAVHAAERGARVLLVTKGGRAKAGATPMAIGTMGGVGPWHEPGDSKELHFLDTVRGGCFLNEQQLLRIMVEEAPARIMELEQRGAYWERPEKGERYLVRTEGGHSHARGVFIESRVGAEIVRTLFSELSRLKVTVYDHLMILTLLEDKGCFGALCFQLRTGNLLFIKCNAIVLATGGPGQIYIYNTHEVRNTGDGLSLALRLGSTLMDMEFEQFYPWGFLADGCLGGLLAGASYFARLYNREKVRFLEKYDPARLEMSTRDIVARAIYQEISEGRGTVSGGVLCDMTHNAPGVIKETLPSLYDFFSSVGVNMEQDPFEIVPTFHYLMGGIKVDKYWQSNCLGLFAVGETAAGVQGANRIGQNSLADILVSGARAGARAAWHASRVSNFKIKEPKLDRLVRTYEDLFKHKPRHRITPQVVRRTIQEIMWHYVGVIRNGKGLQQALDEIHRVKSEYLPRMSPMNSSRVCNIEWVEFFEVFNLIDVAECIIHTGLKREESRGAHFREDFKNRDDKKWLRHITVNFKEDRIVLGTCPVDLSVVGLQDKSEVP
jgi:succinate dehydrogenase/fumarate reductase flavoprotein subunit